MQNRPSPDLKSVVEMAEALRLHAFDDCGGQPVATHIAELAAALLLTQKDRLDKLTAALEIAQEHVIEAANDPSICAEERENNLRDLARVTAALTGSHT